MPPAMIDNKTKVSIGLLIVSLGAFYGLIKYMDTMREDVGEVVAQMRVSNAETKAFRKEFDENKKSQEAYRGQVLLTLDAIRHNTATNGKDVAVANSRIDALERRVTELEKRVRELESVGKK